MPTAAVVQQLVSLDVWIDSDAGSATRQAADLASTMLLFLVHCPCGKLRLNIAAGDVTVVIAWDVAPATQQHMHKIAQQLSSSLNASRMWHSTCVCVCVLCKTAP